jgi:hypothetical protein
MKSEKTKTPRRTLKDSDRDTVLRLSNCGLGNQEIADILHISDSTVSNIRQAHAACIKQDWSTLQKLSTFIRPTVDWAMRVTGTDKVFDVLFNEPPAPPADAPAPAPTPDTITREDFLSLTTALQDICYLLTEIRDTLK